MKTNTLIFNVFLSFLAATIVGADEPQYDPTPDDIAVYQAIYPNFEYVAPRADALTETPEYDSSPEEVAAHELSARGEVLLEPRLPFFPGPPLSSACLACVSATMSASFGLTFVYRISRLRGSTQVKGFAASLTVCGLNIGDPCNDLATAIDESGVTITQSESRWVGHCTAQNGLIDF